MVNPIDYTMNVLSPIEGYMQGLEFGEGIQTNRLNRELAQSQEGRTQEAFAMQKEDRARAIQQQQARAAEVARQRARAEAGNQALLQYYELQKTGKATPNDLREAMLNFPQMTERFSALAGSFSAERTGNEVAFGRKALYALRKGENEAVAALLQERIDAAPDDAARAPYQAQLLMLESDPDSLAMQLTMPMITLDKEFDKFSKQYLEAGDEDLPTEVRELQFRANEGGLVEGTPEYQTFMHSGGESLGNNFRFATPEELEKAGATTGQVNTTTGEFKPIRTGPQTTVTNILGGAEGTLAKELAKGQAQRVTASIGAGIEGSKRLRDLETLGELLTQIDTGASAAVKSLLGKYGIKTEGVELIEAAEAMINRLVPTAREPGSGPMSDRDLELFKKTFPSMLNTPSGNALILSTLEEVSKYEIAEGIIAGKISDWAMTPPADRAADEKAGLIISPQNGRKAIYGLPKVYFSAPVSEETQVDTGSDVKAEFFNNPTIQNLSVELQNEAWKYYKESKGITE